MQKTATSTGVTKYTLHGKNIVHMTQGSNTLHFWYDAQNRPAIVQFNGTKYGYIHNLQGDVIGLIDSNGTEVVKYVYDAWGKILSTTGSLASTLGAIQPFRYRSYVYDQETGLYYLRSRYYNPTWQRLINADDVCYTFSILFFTNLFTYCNNSSILQKDSNGTYSISVLNNRSVDCSGHVDYNKLLNDRGMIQKTIIKHPAQYGFYKVETITLIPVSIAESYLLQEGFEGKRNGSIKELCGLGIEKLLDNIIKKYAESSFMKSFSSTVFLFSCFSTLHDYVRNEQMFQVYNEAVLNGTGIAIVTTEFKEIGNGFRYLGGTVTNICEWSEVLPRCYEE